MGRGQQLGAGAPARRGRKYAVRHDALLRMPLGKECPLCHTVVSEYTGVKRCTCENHLRLKTRRGWPAFRWKLPEARPTDYYPELKAPAITSRERVAICGDTHGNWPMLQDVLIEAGVIDDSGQRQEGFARVIHIGDLMDGRRAYLDRQTLEKSEAIFDEVVMGNHEAAYLGGTSFDGMEMIDPESLRLLNRWEREGKLVVATSVDDWLLVHGGLDPALRVSRKGEGLADAAEVAAVSEELNEIWRFHRHSDAFGESFEMLGQERGGSSNCGGVLWNDFRRLIRTEHAQRYKQVVGHTPQKQGMVSPAGMIVNVDVGRAGRRAASCLIVDENGSELVFGGRR